MNYYVVIDGSLDEIGLVIKGKEIGNFLIKIKNDVGFCVMDSACVVNISKKEYKKYKARNKLLLNFEKEYV